MKKKMYLALAAVLACMLLTGCCLSHQWQEAGCEIPKTCEKCGKTEGEALGHDWKTACEEPETCARCGETRGEAPGHSWVEATCEAPKTCTACGAVEGEALGHRAETGRIVARLLPAAPGSDQLYDARFHVGTCSVCGEEFEEFLGGDEDNKLARGGWSAVSVAVNGQPTDEEYFVELREDGTAVLVQGGMASYGTWKTQGLSWAGERDDLQKEGEEQPWNLSVEILTDGGATQCSGEIDGTDTNSMSLRAFLNGGYTEVALRRGITEEEQEVLDDFAAREALAKEAIVGKWEMRAAVDSGMVADTAAINIQGSEEFSQDGGVKTTSLVQGEESTSTGTWEYLGARKNGDMEMMDLLLTLTNESGETHKERRVLWLMDENVASAFGDLVDGNPVLLVPLYSDFSFVFDKVSD